MSVKREDGDMATKYEHVIPDGYKARIENDKVVIEKIETNDEKIRKALTSIFKGHNNEAFFGVKAEEILAWVEKKQGGQRADILSEEDKAFLELIKGILRFHHKEGLFDTGNINYFGGRTVKVQEIFDWIEKQGEFELCKKEAEYHPRFQVGDWVISDMAHNDYHICRINEIIDGRYKFESELGYCGFNNCETFDATYRRWTIHDAKDGDILTSHACTIIFKELYGFLTLRSRVSYQFYEGKIDGHEIYTDELYNRGIFRPATESERKKFFAKIWEYGYTWNSVDKVLIKRESEPANVTIGDTRRELIKLLKKMSNSIIENYTPVPLCKFVDWLEGMEQEPFVIEKGKWYVCIKDYFDGGKKQCSKGELVQAKGGTYMLGISSDLAAVYFIPLKLE